MGPRTCGHPSAIGLAGGSCLVFTDDGALDAHRAEVETTVGSVVTTVRPLIPIDGVEIRIGSGRSNVIPELGLGGRAVNGETVLFNLDPDSPNLEASLPLELFSLLAHELHHIARQRTVGYGSSLLGAMVSEGLADHFSVEVAGVDPPLWSSALSGPELDAWVAASEPEHDSTSYSHNAWFFGTTPEIPRWTGYAVGFELVRLYREANPGRLASDLHDKPAKSFVP